MTIVKSPASHYTNPFVIRSRSTGVQRFVGQFRRGLFTSLLILTLCTCGRAQLRPDAPVFTYLADQLTDLGLAHRTPNGDFGPTRLALSRQTQLWEPGYVAASWTGKHPWHTGIGGFTPHDYQYRRYYQRQRLNTSFAGGPGQQAIKIRAYPLKTRRVGTELSYFRDDLFRDTDADGRNDLNPTNRLLASVSGDWEIGSISGGTSLQYLDKQTSRQGRANQQLKRLQLVQYLSLSLGRLSPYARLNVNSEHADRDFSLREHRSRRLTTSLQLGLRPNYNYDKALFWEASIDLLHREDQLRLPGLERNDDERFAAATGTFSYDLGQWRLRYNQQLRSSRIDGLTYRPNAQVVYFAGFANLYLTAIVNRGGGYRNPLLSDGNLAFSLREYALAELQSEDFWRRGFSLQAIPLYQVQIDVQAFHFDYKRHTAIRYTDENQISVQQVSGTRRRLLAAQIGYKLPFTVSNSSAPPSIHFNYRYDELTLSDPTGVLLPARHAAWLRLEVPVNFGYSKRRWSNHVSLSYLQQSLVNGLDAEAGSPPARNRFDASLRVQFRDYWIALRGEQLLRRETLSAYGFDPLAGNEDIPLGNEFATVQGRRFTVAVGVGIWKK